MTQHSPTSTFAAALSTYRDLRMVAPSLVTMMSFPPVMLCRILSCARMVLTAEVHQSRLRAGVIVYAALGRTSCACHSLLTMPFGPSVVFTRSAMAMAPTNEACMMQPWSPVGSRRQYRFSFMLHA